MMLRARPRRRGTWSWPDASWTLTYDLRLKQERVGTPFTYAVAGRGRFALDVTVYHFDVEEQWIANLAKEVFRRCAAPAGAGP